MSESMAGVTFLAFGNGSPDVFSTFAAMKTNSGSLAVGELIGAAGFITAVVAGSMALVRPFKVVRKSFVRDVGFFIIAVSFSMVFLADGHLHLWECAVMVGFYVFYVATVFVWHWYLSRQKQQRDREAAARGHFHVHGSGEAEVEIYLDDDGDGIMGGGRTPLRAPSADDFANLERGWSPTARLMGDDVDENTRDHWMSEISSNMRLSRPRVGERRNTHSTIRPSLVGALEFTALLSSLQKSRNIRSTPINLRRYSDDPTYTIAQRQDRLSTTSNPETGFEDDEQLSATSSSFLRPNIGAERSGINRARAVSANDATGLKIDLNPLQRPPVPEIDLLDATPPGTPSRYTQCVKAADSGQQSIVEDSASRMSMPSSHSDYGHLVMSPAPISSTDHRSPVDLLAPLENDFPGLSKNHRSSPMLSTSKSRLSNGSSEVEIGSNVPKLKIPRAPNTLESSPASPFPQYHDDPNLSTRPPSLRLPPPSIGSESTFRQSGFGETEDKPVRWWPYRLLPPPKILVSTLFPTLYGWDDKNLWEKLLGIVAAPSVVLLALTLPVVEADKDDDSPCPDPGFLTPTNRSRSQSMTVANLPAGSAGSLSVNTTPILNSQAKISSEPNVAHSPREMESDGRNTRSLVKPSEQSKLTVSQLQHNFSDQLPELPASGPSLPKEWNRWLVATQIFTAPFFIVLLYWANTDPDLSGRNLALASLYAFIGSLVVFALLLWTTTPTRPPRYRYLFCFVGFVVSIAWISTIANEVVGVLKAFGIILGISDAILGLTIFAVGNSLGDLVADITVARLGYPVMALSACFGGPMLNILLGIGLSGLYMTITAGQGRHERYPDRPMKYKPYQVDVSETLLISGVTLLVTLLGLLIVVPLNRWRMDKKIGLGLVALWCASTIGNVVVESIGWGGDAT